MGGCLNCGCQDTYQRKVFGRTKKRWCFKCRGYFVHDKVAYIENLRYTDKGELINGMYEPICKFECRNCGEEHLRMWY